MDTEAMDFKSNLYGELARLGKGLSSDKRLEILDLLTQAPKAVDSIAKETGISVANTSRHLQILKDSHLVRTERDGNRIIYRIGSSEITQLIKLLIDVGENELSEMRVIQTKADNVDGVQTITLDDAKNEEKSSFILDVRPEDEYQSSHIDGAVNIPLDKLNEHLDLLPKDRQIIVYCRGRLCANSNIAARKLSKKGFQAVSLNSSVQDWYS